MPRRQSSYILLLIAGVLCAPAARAEVGKGHRILIEHGLQIQAQAFYVPQDLGTDRYTFDPKPYLDAGFTGINWHTRPLNVDFATAHPKFPWGRWSMKQGDAELLPQERAYADTFVTFQYRDENSLNDPNIPRFHGDTELAAWKKVIDEVHAAGGLMAPQLWHVGAVRSRSETWRPPGPYDSPSGYSSPGKQFGEWSDVHVKIGEKCGIAEGDLLVIDGPLHSLSGDGRELGGILQGEPAFRSR